MILYSIEMDLLKYIKILKYSRMFDKVYDMHMDRKLPAITHILVHSFQSKNKHAFTHSSLCRGGLFINE